MEVDDLLPIVEASVLLGFATLKEGDVEITPEGGFCRGGHSDAQGAVPRGCIEATLHSAADRKHAAHQADHTIAEEFFHDILDEHFSQDEVERQFETALNWGRYAEIFDYDSGTGRLILDRAGEKKPTVQPWKAQPEGACVRQAHRILRRAGPWSLLPRADLAGAPDLIIFAAGLALFYGLFAVARTLVRPIHSTRGN